MSVFISRIVKLGSRSHVAYFQIIVSDTEVNRCVWLATIPPSCADCLEICGPEPLATSRACPGLYRVCFTLTFTFDHGSSLRTKAPGFIRPIFNAYRQLSTVGLKRRASEAAHSPPSTEV